MCISSTVHLQRGISFISNQELKTLVINSCCGCIGRIRVPCIGRIWKGELWFGMVCFKLFEIQTTFFCSSEFFFHHSQRFSFMSVCCRGWAAEEHIVWISILFALLDLRCWDWLIAWKIMTFRFWYASALLCSWNGLSNFKICGSFFAFYCYL